MRTQVADTSIATFHNIVQDGTVVSQQDRIVRALQRGRNYSLQEICAITSLTINAVSGRVNELKRKGELVQVATRACSVTGRTIHPVALAPRKRARAKPVA